MTHFDTIDHYLPNRDLDTGYKVKPGGYLLADKTYATLLAKLTEHPDHAIPAQLKHDLIAYYADPNAPITTKDNPRKWAQVQVNLTTLQTMKTIGNLDPVFAEMDAEAAAE